MESNRPNSPAARGERAPKADGDAEERTAVRGSSRDSVRSRVRRTTSRRTASAERDRPRKLDSERADTLGAIESSAQEGLMAIGQALEEQLRERPYVTLAAAFGVGVVLSQALSSRVGRIALLAAGGYAATKLLQSDGLGLLTSMLGGEAEADDEGADGDPDSDLAFD